MLECLKLFNCQRRTIEGSAKKQGRRYIELERIYSVRNGSSNKKGVNQYIGEPNNSDDQLYQSDLAEMNGVSVDTWNNYKKLTQLIPEIEDLIDTGIVTQTTALSIVKNLSNEEQEEFIKNMDITKKITQKQTQEYINKIKQLESREPKIIDNTDYTSIKRKEEEIKQLQSSYEKQNRKIELGFILCGIIELILMCISYLLNKKKRNV